MPLAKSPELDLRGKRVTVMGLGSFGGGLGVTTFLADRGARVTVTDLRTSDELGASVRQLEARPELVLHLGGHREQDFQSAELVVVNPAVPAGNAFVEIARNAGVPLTTEMSLFWKYNRGKVAAVTGSNGKSTTTAMLAGILKAAGFRVHLGGNIGRSLLPVVDEIGPDDWVVLELSSFQLEALDEIQAAPEIAVVTNFSPNHLDRHGTLDAYRHAKQAILRWQSAAHHAVLNAEDPDVRNWPVKGVRWFFGGSGADSAGILLQGDDARLRHPDGQSQILPVTKWLRLPGRHNLMNTLAAACAACAAGASPDAIREGIETYQALPHRLQFVVEALGRRFFNDSLATTPESAAAAVGAFDEPIVLLAGGYDKGVDLSPLVDAIGPSVKAVALMGQTAADIERLMVERKPTNATECPRRARFESFEDAFQWAAAQSAAGDVVLLSPGCASYDWFRNFAERGERFVKLARAFAGAPLQD